MTTFHRSEEEAELIRAEWEVFYVGKDLYELEAEQSAMKSGRAFYDLEDLIPPEEYTKFFCAQAGAMVGLPWQTVYYEWDWPDVWRTIAFNIAKRKT